MDNVLSCWLRCFCILCGQKASSAWVYALRTKYLITVWCVFCYYVVPCVAVTVWALDGYLQRALEIPTLRKIFGHKECKNNAANNSTRYPSLFVDVNGKLVTEGLPIHSIHKSRYKRKVYQTVPSNSSECETIWYHTTPMKQQIDVLWHHP